MKVGTQELPLLDPPLHAPQRHDVDTPGGHRRARLCTEHDFRVRLALDASKKSRAVSQNQLVDFRRSRYGLNRLRSLRLGRGRRRKKGEKHKRRRDGSEIHTLHKAHDTGREAQES